jgi:hypothetical protein
MSELLLVNPRKRRVKRRRRARAMTALQARYFGKGRRKARRTTALVSNPAPRRRRRHARRATGAVAAPRRTRRRHSIRRSMRGRVTRLRGFNTKSFLSDTLMPAGIGAAGALGVDVVLGFAHPYLPSFMTTGIGVPLTKIAAAVGLGMVAGMVADRRTGELVMAGGVTVVMYNYLRTMLQTNVPSLQLAGVGNYMGYAGPARAFPDNMGMYVNSGNGGAAIPPAVVAAIAANANASAGKTAPAAQTVGEYVGAYESGYQY